MILPSFLYSFIIPSMKNTTKLEEYMFAYVEGAGDRENGSFTNHIVSVRTLNGPLTLKFWDLKNRDMFPVVGKFLRLRVRDVEKATEELVKYKTLSMDSTSKKPYYCDFVELNDEDVPEETRGKIKKDRGPLRSRVAEMLRDASYWKDSRAHEFLISFVAKNTDKFGTAPAALDHHHAYRGGLFIHTGDVFSNCAGLVNSPMGEFHREQINTDALYLAAWFHDVGKMEIYSMDGDVPKIDSDKDKRIGHIVLSSQIFMRAVEGFGFDDAFVDLVNHCILSHHERKEWGSPVEPATIEAHILCRADFISSRMPD